MATPWFEALGKARPLDAEGLQQLVAEKLRPHYDYQGLLMLRERAVRERDLRELYRGRAPYELLQNADDVGASHAVFVLHPEGLAFLHDGAWFTSRNFENLALGWSDKDPNVCIGNKGLGFRSVLDVTPSPYIFRVGGSGFFGVKFTYALNKGHIDETLKRLPGLREDVRDWGSHRTICPVMSIPGPVRRQSLSPAVAGILDRAAQGHYGPGYTTLFWLPAADPDIASSVLRDLGPTPLTTSSGRDRLCAFLTHEVSALILFLQHILDVRLYMERAFAASVTIPTQRRTDAGVFSVVTDIDGHRHTRTFFQVRAEVRIPQPVRDQPDTSRTLRAMDSARIAVSAEIVDGRPIADPKAAFHVYFPTEEPTGVGFVVHSDFYVKPDRTRLMPGGYNDWLFEEAASLAARRFLTSLLAEHRPRDVFEALRPVASASPGSAAARFVERFKEALRARREPFVPTCVGPQQAECVALPPTVDEDGAWEQHVGDELARTRAGRRFLQPSEDSREAREFLDLAGVQRLPAAAFIDLVESASGEARPAAWWYGCYQHMAAHPELGRWPRERFARRRIVPIGGGVVAAVPDEASGAILILPPRGRTHLPVPPASFARMLEFVEPELADLLWEGDEAVRLWVANQLHIATFEVTDFLPRVVQAVAPQLFTDDGAPRADELAEIWRFVRRSVAAAVRPIHEEAFWDVIGRLPVPTALAGTDATVPPASLVPAFLAYFPNEWLEEGRALAGVRGLRRVAPAFLDLLASDDERERTHWHGMLERAGVSSTPKLLRYQRIVAGQQLPLTRESLAGDAAGRFVGRRQQDENRAILELIAAEGLWPTLVDGAPRCQSHPRQVVLSEAICVDGIAACVAQAIDENGRGDERWNGRLRHLARELPIEAINEAQVVTVCQQCRREERGAGGASAQLERQRWVPTTFGPWTRSEAFLRLAGRHLIGMEPDGTVWGDRLLPYAVADTIDEYGRLVALGVAPLEDAGSAAPTSLLRCLAALGRALTDDRLAQAVVGVRARWRLVRGAVQEVYRALNRQPSGVRVPADLHLAVRTPDGVRFRRAPWHFAEPGSVIERAFSDQLNIVDADRPYAALFRQLGVVTLTAGRTVSEQLVHAAETQPADQLHQQIVGSLAPFLLALVVGRSDDPRHAELAARRLRERFSVRAARSLRLALALTDGTARAEVTVEPFYLQRTVVETRSGLREAAFTLYAVAEASADLFVLDGDALGVALAPVFLDGLPEELAGLFPRVTTRFQLSRGQANAMENFLLQHLGVTAEAQSTAAELLGGEARAADQTGRPTPAARVVVGRPTGSDEALTAAREAALSNLHRTYQAAEEQLAARLAPQGDGRPAGGRQGSPGSGQPVTREQEARGVRGEEEMKRRLQQPQGWEQFRLVRDRREDGCGYDFLCEAGGTEAKLEVKTFAPGGRVVVTLRELQEAHASQRSYYLVGLRDDGGPPSAWQAFILQDPIERLLRLGVFQLETKVEAPPEPLFAAQ